MFTLVSLQVRTRLDHKLGASHLPTEKKISSFVCSVKVAQLEQSRFRVDQIGVHGAKNYSMFRSSLPKIVLEFSRRRCAASLKSLRCLEKHDEVVVSGSPYSFGLLRMDPHTYLGRFWRRSHHLRLCGHRCLLGLKPLKSQFAAFPILCRCFHDLVCQIYDVVWSLYCIDSDPP